MEKLETQKINNNIPLFSKKESKIALGLERVEKILEYFGNPQKKFESVTIAGTVGKGQVTTEIAFELSRIGKIGLYTSPHLERFSERIKIVKDRKSQEISDEGLSYFSNEVWKAERKKEIELTYFEHSTVIAFLFFAENKVDFASCEIGLGGRLDAVACAKSKIGVISRIDRDHEDVLGDDLKSIAYEKALCVPPESTRITIHKKGEIQYEAIYDVSKGEIINDFSWEIKKEEKENFWYKIELSAFEKTKCKEGIDINFFGIKPFLENAVLSSFSSFLILQRFFGKDIRKFDFDLKHIKGRYESFGNIIYDGGHNPISAKAIYQALDDSIKDRKIKVLVSFRKDKKWREFLRVLSPKIEELLITKFPDERWEEEEKIRDFVEKEKIAPKVKIVPYEEAPFICADISKNGDIILITGTFYIYELFKKAVHLLSAQTDMNFEGREK
jgi:dihydrofolate synthase/folylpolyglutamate synthase